MATKRRTAFMTVLPSIKRFVPFILDYQRNHNEQVHKSKGKKSQKYRYKQIHLNFVKT